jgi:hypothetical protein
LLLAGLAFAVTAVAYAVVPTLEDRAAVAGLVPPYSPLRARLRHDGWKWLLVELGFVIAFSALSMVLDRLRSLKSSRLADTIPPGD